MAFYRSDQYMDKYLKNMIDRFSYEGRKNLHENISITWIRYTSKNPSKGSGIGCGWAQNDIFYPASIVKLIYGIAIEVWIENNLILDSEELQRALLNMLTHSSNDATSYIIDILTGTNSGPSLINNEWKIWKHQRQLINKWLESFNWSELELVNCSQKTWEDSPYGRDKDFYGENNENRNKLTTSSIARIFEALMTDNLLSPISSKRIKNYLLRSLNRLDRRRNPENQIDGFLGEGLPENSKFWSKAGLMSEARHDSAWWLENEKNPVLAVVFTKGNSLSRDTLLLPAIANELKNFENT